MKQKSTITYSVILIALFYACTIHAQMTVNQIFTKSETQVVTVNYDDFDSKKSSEFNQSIDLGTYGTYQLSLESSQLFSEGYISRKAAKNNDKLPLTFQGAIQGSPDTKVALTVNEGFLSGFIDTGSEVIFFEPYKTFNADAGKDELIIYYQKDVIDREHACTSNHTDLQAEQIEAQSNDLKSVSMACYEVEMLLVADYGMYQKHGGNTLNHITSVLNNVKSNYNNDFNDPINFTVVDDYIATSSGMDLWSNTARASSLLSEFGNSDYTNIAHDLASLWVSRDIWDYDSDGNVNYSVVGVAYRPGVCGSKYNLMEDFSTNAASLKVAFAHEIGHNFSATHDPAGSSTIMAPSVSATNTWSAQSKNEINAFYPNASCLCASGDAADLAFKSCGTSSLSGSTLSINGLQVQNVGTIATGTNVKTRWYLSTDNTITTNDYAIATRTVTSYPPGSYSTHTFDINLNSTGVPPGNYYLGVITDYDNTVAEFNEDNNTGCVSPSANITIAATQPDLQISNCGQSVVSGTTRFYLNLKVENFGTTTAGASTLGAYLSSNNTVNTSDYRVATAVVPALSGGASSLIDLDFNTAAVNVPPGNYYVGFIADYDDNVTENNESNNVNCISASASITIQGQTEPDLDITTCGTASVSGNLLTVNSVVVKNIGTATAAATTLGYYLSANTVINSSDYLIGTDAVASLTAGNTSTENITQNISAIINPQIPAGTYYVGILADYNSTLAESNENNNTCYDSSPQFTVTYDCKDATAHNYNPNATYADNTTCQTCSDNTINGDETDIDCGGAKCNPCGNITVINPGTGDIHAAGSAINIQWTDNISENVLIRMYTSSGSYFTLTSSTASDGSFNYTIPSSRNPGQYRIYIRSVSNTSVSDYGTYFTIQAASSCTDNVQNGDETGVDCGGSCPPCEPDLDITTCGTVSKSGNTITVSGVVVKNIGTATAASTTLGYYLSTNTTINNNDYLIGTDYVASLAADNTSSESITKNISTINPPIPAGTYYVGMRADYQSGLSESNENNNTCYDSSPQFTVTYDCKDATAHNYNPNATYADNTTCQTCSDGVKNGDETDIDCGGTKCQPCGNITVTNPSTGNTYAPGDAINIQWTDNISENVLIRMYSSAGWYYNITSSTASDGSHSYTTLSSAPDGQYRIYIQSTTNSAVNDYGDFFTVETPPQGTIAVTNPSTGNTYAPGDAINIQWTDNISENVLIRMYSSAGWYYNITSSTASDGSHSYTTLSSAPDGQYRIYIQSTTNSAVNDYGDFFTVEEAPTCTLVTPAQSYTEDFETLAQGSTSCGATITLTNGWTNDTNDDVDWTVDSGGTPSGTTGPSTDTNPGTATGKYLYVEASSSCSNSKAVLLSPCLDLSSLTAPVLSFSYHMNGSQQGTLELGVSTINTPNITWIPIATGNQGNEWKTVDGTTLSPVDDFQILFRVTTGDGYMSDIAIDDIQIKEASTNNCGDDANTLLLLPFDDNLNGTAGETPAVSEYVSLTAGKYANGVNVMEYSDVPALKYNANSNINSQQGTVEAWVKPTWNGNDGAGHTLLQYGGAGGILILKDGANNLRLIINRWSPSGYPEMGVGYNISNWQANQWKHVAFTWGGGQLELYLDGSLIAQQQIDSTPLFPISDADFNIGTDGGNNTWQGVVDHFRISNTVRSQAQITDFMNNCASDKVIQNQTIDTHNYPNPFADHTTIEYTLVKDSPVTLMVYDAAGRQVAVLHNNETKTAGTHSTTFEGNLYPAGVYYYTIQAGGYFGTQKMVLMK